ncbi:unnamed protein product [Effrenium voratum]|nr:unnamed protein product [Effrenium voratum]
MALSPWDSLRDFAGFRGAERKPVTGRLAVPPPENEPPVPVSAADRVKQRLAALRGNATPQRIPGIAQRASKAKKEEDEEAELLAFRCPGRCGHRWVTGRGATASEQICKWCGESVVGVPSKGSVFCEIDQDAASAGEVVRIRLEQHVAPGWATLELEDRLVQFVRSEVKFISQFFDKDGVRDYIAYRQGRMLEEAEGRDRNKDALLVERLARVVEALCKAEFTGSMRAGEADAKLQALLEGDIRFAVLSAPERDAKGAVVTAEVDFRIMLDVEDRIADKADDRLQQLRKVAAEIDKKVLAKSQKDVATGDHPRQLLAAMIASLDWRRGLSDNLGREGHDRIRCMTCRFLEEDCSTDIARSREVRQALRALPSFVFTARVVLVRTDGQEDWQSKADLLEAVAQTKSNQCLVRARPEGPRLLLQLFSSPEWLQSAVERLQALAAPVPKSAPLSLSGLVGLGRSAQNLRVAEEVKFEAICDIPGFLQSFLDPSGAWLGHVRWCDASQELLGVKTAPVSAKGLQDARRTFRAYCALEELPTFVDFLRDFRQKGAAQARPQPRLPKPRQEQNLQEASGRRSRSRSRRSPRSPRSPRSARSPRSPRARARRSPSYGAYRPPGAPSPEKRKKTRRKSSSSRNGKLGWGGG